MNKGRVYKKWFRADAAWDVNFGPFTYPEAFYLPFHSEIFSSRYAVSQIHRVMGINLNKGFVRKWTSPTYGGFFDNVYWTFEVLGPPDEPVFETRFAIWHQAVIDTPLYDATYRSIISTVEWNLWTLLNAKELHWLSPEITVNPYPLRLTIQAARYDRYNP